MIIVAGYLDVDAEARDEFVADSATAVTLARSTPGCLDFAVSADSVDPGRANVLERWESAAALLAFRGNGPDDGMSAHIQDFQVEEYEVVGARLD